MKQLKVQDATHRELMFIKTKENHKTVDDVIWELIKARLK